MDDVRARGMELDRRAPMVTPSGETLTWDQVERELSAAGPAPKGPADQP